MMLAQHWELMLAQRHKMSLGQCWAGGHFNVGPTSQNDVGPTSQNVVGPMLGQPFICWRWANVKMMLAQRHKMLLPMLLPKCCCQNVANVGLADIGPTLAQRQEMMLAQRHKMMLGQRWAGGHFNVGPTSRNDVGPTSQNDVGPMLGWRTF